MMTGHCATCVYYQRDGVGKGRRLNPDSPLSKHKRFSPRTGCDEHKLKEVKQ